MHAQSDKATSDLQAKNTQASVQSGELGCFLRGAVLQQIWAISPINCELIEVSRVFTGVTDASRKSQRPFVLNLKIPEQFPLNYLLIGQTGSNLPQIAQNLSACSADMQRYTNREAPALTSPQIADS